MVAPVQSQVQSIIARAAAADPSLFKPGQVLEALVLGKAPDGLMAIKIGETVVNAQLPPSLPAGTTLQLQVKSAGAALQLAVVGTPQVPVAAPQVAVQRPVLPQGQVVVPLPQAAVVASTGERAPQVPVQPGPLVQQVRPDAAAEARPGPAPVTVVAAPPLVPRPVAPQAGQTFSAPPPAQGEPAPLGAARVAEQAAAPAVVKDARPPSGGQIVESRQPVAPQSAPIESRAAQVPPVVVVGPERAARSATLVPAAPAPVGQLAPPASPQPAPQFQLQTPTAAVPAPQAGVVASSPPVQVAPTLSMAAATPLPPSAVPVAVTPSIPAAALPEAQPALPSAMAAPSSPTLVSSPSKSVPAASNVASPVAAQPAVVQPAIVAPAGLAAVAVQSAIHAQAPAVPVSAPAAPEAEAPSPLLIAQAASRPLAGAVEFGRAWPSAVGTPQASAQPAATAPAAALAQMVPEAMGRQNSLAPLLASLAVLVARPAAVPEPVLRAAMQLLSQRVPVSAAGPTAETLEGALAKSGVYLEAGLAKGAPAPDIKSALVALKSAAATWLGGNPAPLTGTQQPAPPLRGLPPRAEAPELPPLPEAPREAARAIHSQADAALSRVKLMQLASLPDMADPARATAPELRMEVPFVFGQQLVMAQFQVFRDREHQRSDGRRGWTMRFAMNFAEGGEVGAEVGLLGKAVNVALWAADPETAADLEAALPELAPALTALGLEPGAVRIRSAPAEQPKPFSGHIVDSRR